MPIAKCNGIEIEYEVVGTGEPIVLVMGFASQRIIWPRELIDQLTARGFQVVTFDNRDVGKSTKLDHLGVPDVRKALLGLVLGQSVPGPYRIADMALDVVGLMDALRIERAHVAGVSMGGMIAQELALGHPERLLTMTSIMSTPGGRRNAVGDPAALRQLLKKPAKTREEYSVQLPETFRVLGGPGYTLDTEHIRALANEAWDRGVYPKGAARQLGAIFDASADRRARLPQVRVPSLVMHGTHDPLIPERAGRATAKLIPGARYVPIDGMGHNFPPAAMPLIAGAIESLVLVSRPERR